MVKPFLIEERCEIYCIQETHFLSTDIYGFNLPNYTRYDAFGSEVRRQGGVSIYISNKLPHSKLQIQTHLQAVACLARIGNVRIAICSLYLPPDEVIHYDDLEHLTDQLPEPLLICTDANSRHMLWGSDRCDRRGLVWERLIRTHDLCVLNSGEPTRMDDYTGNYSHIDLTMITSSLAPYADWTTDSDLHDSDHFPIYITLDKGEETSYTSNMFYGWNLNKAMWNVFREKCVLHFEEELGIQNCKIMTEAIIKGATETIPRKTGQSKYSCPWWTSDCKEALRERKRMLNRFRRHKDNVNLLMEYKKAKAKARQVVRKAKKESWERLLSMFNCQTSMSKLWGIIRKFTCKTRFNRPLPVLKINGATIDDTLEVGNELGKYFSQMSSQDNYSTTFQRRVDEINNTMPDFQSDNSECYNEPFNITELNTSIQECGNTAIGPDMIHYAFFKQMGEMQVNEILKLFNYIWSEGCFPTEWTHSYIIPVLKPGKPACKPESYRPIQLTSCFGKLMERMIAKRLGWFVEKEGILSRYQGAFIKHRSTVDHIVRLESEIRRGFFNHQYTLAVFLDFKNAFNLVSTPALLLKLYKLGFRGRLMTFVNNYLSGRTFQVKCGQLSDTFEQENGVVQGGVVSQSCST